MIKFVLEREDNVSQNLQMVAHKLDKLIRLISNLTELIVQRDQDREALLAVTSDVRDKTQQLETAVENFKGET